MRLVTIAAGALALTACATAGDADDGGIPVRAPTGECDAEAAQHLLGATASEAVGAELLELTGARQLRWVPPRTAVTMDFRPDRLTVSYDDDLVIERIACG